MFSWPKAVTESAQTFSVDALPRAYVVTVENSDGGLDISARLSGGMLQSKETYL